MLKSMTAYSRFEKQFKKFDITVEMQSVNRKHLDIQCQLPQEALAFESDLRSLLSTSIGRGQITLHCAIHYKEELPYDVQISMPLAKKLQMSLATLVGELGLSSSLAEQLWVASVQKEQVITIQKLKKADEKLRTALLDVAKRSLAQLHTMKIKEGGYIQKEFERRLSEMKKRIMAIAKRMPTVIAAYKKRLQELSSNLEMHEGALDENAISKQMIHFADKVDIAEEVSRFTYHLAHIGQILKSKESSGKLIEFVLQELLREANTIGSKAQESLISTDIILIKAEIEKMREQVQNVE